MAVSAGLESEEREREERERGGGVSEARSYNEWSYSRSSRQIALS